MLDHDVERMVDMGAELVLEFDEIACAPFRYRFTVIGILSVECELFFFQQRMVNNAMRTYKPLRPAGNKGPADRHRRICQLDRSRQRVEDEGVRISSGAEPTN